ncbi:MAG: hypothetical protein N2205_05755 [Candidatus Caldatribacterium sp.]|nr:hypothetical protein [Candidatus Caldatribacterium sp.]
MKGSENFWILLLALVVGVLGFLSLRIVELFYVFSSFAQESKEELVFPLPRSSDIARKEVFLAPLREEEIGGLRDVFSFAQPQKVVQEEIVSSLGEEESTSLHIAEEVLPEITLKGVVVSPRNQVVVVEIAGEIFFLTSEKPLSGELRLVKVDEKEVVLMYRGREVVFSLEE